VIATSKRIRSAATPFNRYSSDKKPEYKCGADENTPDDRP